MRVRHCLTFSRLTYQSLAILCVRNYGRRGAIALSVLKHARLSPIHDGYTRVGCPKVDTNNFTHLNVSTKNSSSAGCEPVIRANLTVSTALY
ncbi:Hypothetical protein ABZS17D1_03510 [Kosakonia cowanii]